MSERHDAYIVESCSCLPEKNRRCFLIKEEGLVHGEIIFVDTGAWVALADKDDKRHAEAVSIFPIAAEDLQGTCNNTILWSPNHIFLY